MAAGMWTDRGRRTVTVLGTLTRSRSSHAALKSRYDALVIGGGEIRALFGQKVQEKTLEQCYSITTRATLHDIGPTFAQSLQK